MDIKEELIVVQPLPSNDGYTWTITSRLGDILANAETMFGERDKTYTILGVEFANTDRPRIWFPGNRKQIAIQLNRDALNNIDQALYQLSHEIIHCLSPTGNKDANILEEGLATFYSEWYLKEKGFRKLLPSIPEYFKAQKLVKELLTIDFMIIKKVRSNQPIISAITPDDVIKVNPNIDRELLDRLCLPFY